jgi:two-component system nitrate/nitrite sensor histidine kinase NarX
LTRGALAEMRTLLLELRPSALIETGLGDLLHQLGEAAAGRAGVPVSVEVSGDCIVPPDVHVVLYRVGQEALNNVVKHARASEVQLSLHCAAALDGRREVELEIRDDGRGFDPEDIAPDHLGLGIMRERAETIGADLQIQTAPGSGSRVRLSWIESRLTDGVSGR